MVRVLSPPQSRSQAVVCVSTPRMYPQSGYFLVNTKTQRLHDVDLITFEHIQKLENTRKYPLRGCILGVLTHTTAWDRKSKEDDEILK